MSGGALHAALRITGEDLRANHAGRLGDGQRVRLAALAGRVERTGRTGLRAGWVLLGAGALVTLAGLGARVLPGLLGTAGMVAVLLGLTLVLSWPLQARARRAMRAFGDAPVERAVHAAVRDGVRYRAYFVRCHGALLLVGAEILPRRRCGSAQRRRGG